MKIWQMRKRPEGRLPLEWAEELDISPRLLEILWKRGFDSPAAMDDYLSARLKNLTRPSLWPQIPEAAQTLAQEILKGRKIAVWGDYDVDGITATTIVLDVLEAHGFGAMHHLPDRMSEGYGLNVQAIEELASQGCEVLLTVDCGISNQEAIRRANELGLTVIVSDHHLPPENLPEARAIVNPRISEAGDWPCIHLAGVGVAFYIMAAVNALLAEHTKRRYKMDKALDMVALGTLADVMNLEGENRILVRGGLEQLGSSARPGMAALKLASGFDRSAKMTSGQVVYRLAPRINAAGRMGHPDLALRLLRAKDYRQAQALAEELNDCNSKRKAEEDRIYNQACAQARELLEKKNYAGLTLFGADWHPGIVGIVASRIVEEFNKPAIVLCQDNYSLKGSGRSVADFDLYAGLAGTAHLLEGYGGHRQAAGVRLAPGNLPAFREAFSDAVREQIGEKPSLPVLTLDCELDFSVASDHDFLRELQLMQPFGPGNAEPVFMSPPLLVRRRAPLGYSREHVLLELEDKKHQITLTAKAWRMAGQLPETLVNKEIVIAYTPRVDTFRGMPCIDLGLKDWRPA